MTGRYLTVDSTCSLCEDFWSTAMIVGSSGSCIETCGDGRNYGLLQCDDGKLNNGDGCSSQCIVEKNYTCTGGYPYSLDKCTYIPTEITRVSVNEHNDIVIKFSRPVKLGNLTNRDL